MVDRRFRLLKCVADETRFKTLLMLKKGERCVCEIVDGLGKEQSLVSHHLKALRECGFVRGRREGKKVMYELADDSVLKLLADIEELSERLC